MAVLTDGASVSTNVAILESNAALTADIAAAVKGVGDRVVVLSGV